MSGLWIKMKAKARWAGNDLAARLGMGPEEKPSGTIRRALLYHGIDLRGERKLNSRFLDRKTLEVQLEWLANHCQVVSPAEYFEGQVSGERPMVCLTFDDGYANNFTYALPLLQKFGLPATFFLTALPLIDTDIQWADLLDLVCLTSGEPLEIKGERYQKYKGAYRSQANGRALKEVAKTSGPEWLSELRKALNRQAGFRQQSRWNDYWKMMNEAQVKALAGESLATLGTHGRSHACFDALDETMLDTELREPKEWLESLTGKKVEDLAYPSGAFSEKVARRAEALGYLRQWGVNLPEKFADDPRIEGRLTLNPHISWTNQRWAIIKGHYL